MQTLRALIADTRGVTAAEYVLILAILSFGLAVAAIALESSISGSMEDSADLIASRGKNFGAVAAATEAKPSSASRTDGFPCQSSHTAVNQQSARDARRHSAGATKQSGRC
jgi:Flp pilus assembly pilin Flp